MPRLLAAAPLMVGLCFALSPHLSPHVSPQLSPQLSAAARAAGPATVPASAGPESASPAPTGSVPTVPEPTVTVTALDPRAPTPADRLVVRGYVTNPGRDPLLDARVRLRIGTERMRSRSELAAISRSTAPVGVPVADPAAAQDLGRLAGQARVPFRVTAAVRDLGLAGLGVYPLGLDVRAQSSAGVAVLGRVRTWLPFGPRSSGAAPTRISWVWPLLAAPDRNPDGTFPSDSLAAQLRPGGRLSALLDAASLGPGRPSARAAAGGPMLTYAVDPALLEDVAAMARGYSVRRPDGRLVPGTGTADALAWLARLRRLAASTPVVALPYGDPDVVAMVRAGRAADVGLASASATFRQLVRDVLGTAPLERVAWPPDGMISQPALDALTGVDTLILSGAAMPPRPQLSYTPDAATTLPAAAGGRLRVLASDPTLDALLAGPEPAAGRRLAEQRFLAETLMITAEEPSSGRAILLAPPRRWSPSAGQAAALLRDSTTVPWLAPVSLASLTPPPHRPDARGPLTYPPSAARAELPGAMLARTGGIGSIARQLGTYRAILTDPESAGVPAVERALLRCESAAWRTDPAGGLRLRNTTSRMLSELVAKVRITTRGEVSLASKRSTIPVSVANGLAQPIRVQVALQSTAARLLAEDSGVKTISGGHQIQLSVRLQAPAAGVFPVTAGLLTPDGRPYGSAVKLLVHATRYGTLALAITAAAFVVLGSAATMRVVRRVRAARAAEPGR